MQGQNYKTKGTHDPCFTLISLGIQILTLHKFNIQIFSFNFNRENL